MGILYCIMSPVEAHSLSSRNQSGRVCYMWTFYQTGRDVTVPRGLEWDLTTENSRNEDNRAVSEKVQCFQASELTY